MNGSIFKIYKMQGGVLIVREVGTNSTGHTKASFDTKKRRWVINNHVAPTSCSSGEIKKQVGNHDFKDRDLACVLVPHLMRREKMNPTAILHKYLFRKPVSSFVSRTKKHAQEKILLMEYSSASELPCLVASLNKTGSWICSYTKKMQRK